MTAAQLADLFNKLTMMGEGQQQFNLTRELIESLRVQPVNG